MEAITSTEKLISSFNKFSKERNPEDLSMSAKMTIDLFSRRVSQGKVRDEEIADFSEKVLTFPLKRDIIYNVYVYTETKNL